MVYFNNRYIPAQSFAVNSGNRAFKYGDALFETLLLINKKTPLLSYNLQRLKKGMQLLGILIPENWNISFFENIITTITNELGLENGRCKITVWRDGGGFYKPEINDAALLIEITPITLPVLTYVEKNLVLGVYADYPKMIHPVSACKTANALPYVLAARYAVAHQMDDVLLLNTEDFIADALSSNVVIVKNNAFYTTTPMNGGVEGTMQNFICDHAADLDISISRMPMTVGEVLSADEVLLTNAIQGVLPVTRFQGAVYENNSAIELLQKLKALITSL